jgi:acetolactate decarboxylase
MNKIFIFSLVLLLTSCSSINTPENNTVQRGEQLYQISTINALLAGIYDGDLQVKDVKKNSDFGLGTFNGINGEMIVHEGAVYQVLSNGSVVEADDNTGVPFASAHFFLADINSTIQDINSYNTLKSKLNLYTQCKNYPCAFKIHGTFNNIKVRSEVKASKPYPPLAEYMSKNQKFFTAKNIKGTLIGYDLPQYFEKLNVPGYHFHFISDDKSFGGHVLELSLKTATLQLDQLFKFNLVLLRNTEFTTSDLKTKKSDLDKVEK